LNKANKKGNLQDAQDQTEELMQKISDVDPPNSHRNRKKICSSFLELNSCLHIIYILIKTTDLGEMIKINKVQITLEIPTSIDASFIMKMGLGYAKTWHP
jgi:hypothetical protein